jgi:hypothetical protein
MSPCCSSVSIDAQFDLLTSDERRSLLSALREVSQPDDAVQALDTVEPPAREADLVALRHVHLPKLESHGVIRWDRDENAVRQGPAFEDIRPLLQFLETTHDGVDA